MTVSQDDAIRNYLANTLLLEEMQAGLPEDKTSSDPLDILAFVQHEVYVRKEEVLRPHFVTHAARYATSHNITSRAYRLMGVPAHVINLLGFDPVAAAPAPDKKAAAKKKPASPISKAVRDQAIATVCQLEKTFTTLDVQAIVATQHTNVSVDTSTVRSWLSSLVDQGKVVKTGLVAHPSRGRSPMGYQVVKKLEEASAAALDTVDPFWGQTPVALDS